MIREEEAVLRAWCLGIGLLLALGGERAAAADLTIWWAKGFYPEEDEGIRRVVEAFQRDTGTSVELTFYTSVDIPVKLLAALQAGQPPDVSNGSSAYGTHFMRWAYEGRYVDLGDIVEPIATGVIDPIVLRTAYLLNGRTGKPAYYSLPLAVTSIHIHVWRSLLEQAGIGMHRIPREWTAFWDFFCDTVQPAVREATGKAAIYGVGLPSSTAGDDTTQSFTEFLLAHEAWFVDAKSNLLLDQPGMRRRIVETLEDFTRFSKKGCNPPGAVAWGNTDNNANFLNQVIMMTPNATLSIPASQRTGKPEDYYNNIATIAWPIALDGEPLPLLLQYWRVEAYAAGRNPAGAKAFLRYLIQPERLGPYIEAAQGRHFPVLRELADAPFWADTADPHVAELRRQMTSNPKRTGWLYQSLGLERVYAEKVWPRAIGRILLEGWTADRAADEAIARTKQIVGR